MTFVFLFLYRDERVSTSALKTFPSISPEEPVEIYFSDEFIPIDSETLGIVKAVDTGLTISSKCDSLTTVEYLKTEARKMGGNAVLVSDYSKPSVWGSSCHQMTGTILWVYDFDSIIQQDPDEENTMPPTIISKDEMIADEGKIVSSPQRTFPRFRIAADFGYGWRTAKLPDNLNSIQREFFKKMNSGLAFQGTFTYLAKNHSGIGLNYTALTGDAGSNFNIKGKSLINYIGVDYVHVPQFLMHGIWICV